MQTIESLKKQIKTTHDLLSVVKTMKSLAAVNIRQYEGAVRALAEYSRIVDLGWQVLFRTRGDIHALKSDPRLICLVLGSDQGMCGQFNEVILETARQKEKKWRVQNARIAFWTVGERVRAGLGDTGRAVDAHFDLPGSLAGITSRVQLLVQAFEARQRAEGVETFYLLFNRMTPGGGYQPVCIRLLPLDEQWLDRYRNRPWPNRCLPQAGLPRDQLFGHLFRQYVFVSIYRAFAQSMASENAARLKSMQAAEKNILELREELQGKFRETRQSNITAELLDIISGFEAIQDES
jgi:F-type H+-transporting ATPase subunit gamma